MAVSQDVNDALNAQIGEWKPSAVPANEPVGKGTANEPRAEPGWSTAGSLGKFAGDIGSALVEGVAQGGDFAKGIIAGTLMPLIPEGETPGAKAAWALLRPSTDVTSKYGIEQRAERPETVAGSILAPAAKGVGSMVAMPMPGGIARNVIAGMGMGEGAEWSGKLLKGVFDYFGGPEMGKVGQTTGEILGGGIGAQANISRMRAMGLAGKTALSMPQQATDAFRSALGKRQEAMQAWEQAGQQGDKPRLWAIFADEFGSLRAKTQGIVQDYTNAVLADAIRRDIRASGEAKDFTRDITLTGIDPNNWGLPERTMVPALTLMAAKRTPQTIGETEQIAGAAGARKQAIIDAYNRLVGRKLPATAQGAEAAGKAMQAITQAKINALDVEREAAKGAFPDLSPQDKFALGEQARALRDQMAKDTFAVARGKYAQAEEAFAKEGVQIPLGTINKTGKDILSEFVSITNPAEVPPVVRSIVGGTAAEKGVAAPGLILPADLAAERAAANAPKEKMVALSEANDLARALNNMASKYLSSERSVEYGRTKVMLNELLDSISGSKASPEAKAMYEEARKFWANQYAPRFNEGIGKALGKERTGVLEGREAVPSETVYSNILQQGKASTAAQETALREADMLFGQNPAYMAGLARTLEGGFRDSVLNMAKTPDALERAIYDFKLDNKAALARLPAVADKIDAIGARSVALMAEKERELERYKALMKGPITQEIGPLQAKTFLQNVLSDPIKMDQTLRMLPKDKGAENLVKEVFVQAHPFRNGEYNPEALHDLLYAGKNSPTQKSSLEKLFTAAFGEQGGKEHFDTLDAIANFTKREAATNPQNLRPTSLLSDSPIMAATGQRLASWISAWRATQVGAAGSTFFTMLGLSRFANARAQAAVEAAKQRALYDPETAKAILELAATPATSPVSIGSLRKVFGDLKLPNGERMVDYLVDKGFGKEYAARGIAYGIEQAEEDRKRNFPATTTKKLEKPLGYIGSYK